MPGIDGPSLCRRLRAWPPTRAVPVIFVTGLPRERLLLRLAGCEPWWFLPKPCSIDDLIGAVRVQHPVCGDARAFGPGAPAVQPVKLAGRVRVGVDGERAARLDGQPQQPAGRILAFGATVDLHGDGVVPAGGEHGLRIELRLRPAAAGE